MLIVTFVYVAAVSFGMTVMSVGFNGMLIPAWLHIYPVLFAGGYIVSLFTMPAAVKLASALICHSQN
jgi:hypothetical protein